MGKKASISLEVEIDNDAFKELVKAAANVTVDHFVFALAKAMPWFNIEARSIVERRRRLYMPLWKTYLNEPDHSYRYYASDARKTLQQLENGAEAAFLEGEIPFGSSKTAWTVSFAEMLQLNGTEAGGRLNLKTAVATNDNCIILNMNMLHDLHPIALLSRMNDVILYKTSA